MEEEGGGEGDQNSNAVFCSNAIHFTHAPKLSCLTFFSEQTGGGGGD